jgi:hypothetical protein
MWTIRGLVPRTSLKCGKIYIPLEKDTTQKIRNF